ncbi:MAG: hypothetical protein J6C75_01455 [Oscillospiraceae bacterium]|nr:hypothetical protein [Oscillospiraceae bacterium]
MTENMKKFLELAAQNSEIRKKAEELDSSMQGLIALAAEHGITLCESDFPAENGALDDDALDNIAGGVFVANNSFFKNLMYSQNDLEQVPTVQAMPYQTSQTPNIQTMELKPNQAPTAQNMNLGGKPKTFSI